MVDTVASLGCGHFLPLPAVRFLSPQWRHESDKNPFSIGRASTSAIEISANLISSQERGLQVAVDNVVMVSL